MAKIPAIFFLCFVLVQISSTARIKRQEGDIAFPGDLDVDDRYGQNQGNQGNHNNGNQGGVRPGRPANGGQGGQNQQGGRPGNGGQGGGRPGQNQGGRPGQNQQQGGGRPSQNQQQSTTRRTTTTPAGQTATANPECERRCLKTPEYNPVCGTNRVTYTNIGTLECARRCGLPDLQFMRLGNCPREPVLAT